MPVIAIIAIVVIVIILNKTGVAWRVWNFEPDAGAGLNPYIRQYGILKETSAH